ncbi:ATPase H+ transporting accessory protein 1 like b [Lates japonicus]|uniref:ATPase H+ transporting accessory protein 1 like b n=1 Tax=Lates japonicus TaxID=270547 RepID=A0AAD3M272_LATJO|nr:ATPase H+ transporting accessory protein 1 like b [Lates japonicus]
MSHSKRKLLRVSDGALWPSECHLTGRPAFCLKPAAIRYETTGDLTKVFNTNSPVDTKILSAPRASHRCQHFALRQLGRNWFTLDSVHIHYNWTQEATFKHGEVSRSCHLILPLPARCLNLSICPVSLCLIQAFNVQSDKFASASDCATFLTPAILMGLVTSLILLLVLAYALHMVVHLKHIDRYEEHKATVYFPRSPEAELPDKNSL